MLHSLMSFLVSSTRFILALFKGIHTRLSHSDLLVVRSEINLADSGDEFIGNFCRMVPLVNTVLVD